MDEKILVKSTSYNALKIVGVILAVFLLLIIILGYALYMDVAEDFINQYNVHRHYKDDIARKLGYNLDCYNMDGTRLSCKYSRYNSGFAYAWAYSDFQEDTFPILLIGVGAAFLICLALYLWLRSYELTVTDKRVYGKCAFGKRVDLPNDSISAIAMVPLLKGVAVATSSGKISFLLIKNLNEIYEELNKQLMERQNKKTDAPAPVVTVSNQSNADELKKYKELLDSGVITQEEFDTMKKQLIGL